MKSLSEQACDGAMNSFEYGSYRGAEPTATESVRLSSRHFVMPALLREDIQGEALLGPSQVLAAQSRDPTNRHISFPTLSSGKGSSGIA